MLLLVGANGWLGKQATEFFRKRGHDVLTASHRQPADVVVDFSRPADSWRSSLPGSVDRAIVLSGATNIDDCRRNEAATRALNVDGPVAFFEEMRRRAAGLVFVSTDLVFAGDRGDYKEHDERLPTTEYGRQKKDAEDYVLERCPDSLVVRLSKLYNDDADDPSPVGFTRRELLAGRRIRAAYDQVVVPTYTQDALNAIEALMAAGNRGAFHVAAQERHTRLSLARLLAERMGRAHLVDSCSIHDFSFCEPRPRDNSLNTDRLHRAVDVSFSRVSDHLGG
jgi:dTDP-4-dehydrorhamnose reductase